MADDVLGIVVGVDHVIDSLEAAAWDATQSIALTVCGTSTGHDASTLQHVYHRTGSSLRIGFLGVLMGRLCVQAT